MLEFRVLGALGVSGSAGEVALGGAKQRLALALLVLQAGQFVSREALVDALWPQSPPPTATHAVESYISRLRRLLKAAGATGPVVEFGPAGYRLPRDGSRFDHLAFATLADAARGALAREDYAAASTSAHEALGLWRGPALAGLASEPALLADAAALDERRVSAFELWAAAELGLGRHAGLIGELIAVAQRQPTRERLQELAMLALYRAGRKAEALDVYRATAHRRGAGAGAGAGAARARGAHPPPRPVAGGRPRAAANEPGGRARGAERRPCSAQPLAGVSGRWRSWAACWRPARSQRCWRATAAATRPPSRRRCRPRRSDGWTRLTGVGAARSDCPRRPRVWRQVWAQRGRRPATRSAHDRDCDATIRPR